LIVVAYPIKNVEFVDSFINKEMQVV